MPYPPLPECTCKTVKGEVLCAAYKVTFMVTDRLGVKISRHFATVSADFFFSLFPPFLEAWEENLLSSACFPSTFFQASLAPGSMATVIRLNQAGHKELTSEP